MAFYSSIRYNCTDLQISRFIYSSKNKRLREAAYKYDIYRRILNSQDAINNLGGFLLKTLSIISQQRDRKESSDMFEKSLYDLIRGLRNHKGNEKEYIQDSLRECRAEIKGQDKDLKATALLKLIYLEMFGYDMSWAAFHVLEVMSSAKYLQKRVGYLGAVQSFRPDTEVLMLATNLLKKDLSAATVLTLSLPITTLPHIVTPSLALSTLQEILPRMNHSDPSIRKKTIVTLYRLALVYPETLRSAWPKIKERLMDEEEDSSVTAAIVNVVCELGWRRPQDFLPLARRLFDLLVNGGNNWMAIKLIKLFATLTPLEPRLIRKILPPLTNIIRTTPAMSLLYECINGIIQGGILDCADERAGGEEIATLCVSKLRGMIMVEGDANLKYVALLAFKKIVVIHPLLVAQQEDVIMECIDSPDISIRLGALDLVVGIINSDNLASIVGRLMRQLKDTRSANSEEALDKRPRKIEIIADSDDESLENVTQPEKFLDEAPPLSDEYKLDVISTILNMCSCNNYGNLIDFEWYIDILIQLVRMVPTTYSISAEDVGLMFKNSSMHLISERIGEELRNIAVKVKAIRHLATRAAENILISSYTDNYLVRNPNNGFLGPIAWTVGEFVSSLVTPESALTALLQLSKTTQCAHSTSIFIHAVIKIFSFMITSASDKQSPWNSERKSMISLIMARIIDTLEPLTLHPDLEVQARAAEYSELLKLSTEAVSKQNKLADPLYRDFPPLLMTQAIPSLFSGFELNSIAPGAQKKVPLPPKLDLDQPINPNLSNLLKNVDFVSSNEYGENAFDAYYHQRSALILGGVSQVGTSRALYEEDLQQPRHHSEKEEGSINTEITERRRVERIEKNKDDPFYISPSDTKSETSLPLHSILQANNGIDFDINTIPIMQLDLGRPTSHTVSNIPRYHDPLSTARKKIEVAPDETLASSDLLETDELKDSIEVSFEIAHKNKPKKNQSLLQVDSSHIGIFSLEESCEEVKSKEETIIANTSQNQKDDIVIMQAMKEVERLGLEMQRAKERIPNPENAGKITVVKKKKKTKSVRIEDEAMEIVGKENAGKKSAGTEDEDGELVKKKKKKKYKKMDSNGKAAEEVLPKKKKKFKSNEDERQILDG